MSKLYIVGIGPGEYEQMTVKAARILEKCQVIVGYTVYTELVRPHFPEKEYLTTPMRKERERVRMALTEAEGGRDTAFVCSGDPGVYGMAGLAFEEGVDYPSVEIEIIPGVTAALSGAALLGAPLIHDFAVISLSDLMTPWEEIERRIINGVKGDFVLCIYNPASRGRQDYMKKVCDTALSCVPGDRLCGIVRNVGREGEMARVMNISQLREEALDMFTTVFIGNSKTQNIGGRMVTPRGYSRKNKTEHKDKGTDET